MKFENFVSKHFYLIMGAFFGILMGGLALDTLIH